MLIHPDRHVACRVQDHWFHVLYFMVPKKNSINLGLKLPIFEGVDNSKFNYVGDNTISMSSKMNLFEVFILEDPPHSDPKTVNDLFRASFLDTIQTEINI